MQNPLRSLLSVTALGVVLAGSAQAQLRFTEAMSSSGSGGTPDWFELTNLGSSAVDITGYKFDDSSAAFANAVALLGVTSIAAGQSVVFVEGTTTDVDAFRAFWGGLDSAVIGFYSGSGISFSSGGDGLNLYTGAGVFVTGESFGAASSGVSFGFDPATATFGALSAAGVNGAFVSANALANVGSPGAIPEPASAAALLGGLALAGVAARRRR